jgi:hypothetical protein
MLVLCLYNAFMCLYGMLCVLICLYFACIVRLVVLAAKIQAKYKHMSIYDTHTNTYRLNI